MKPAEPDPQSPFMTIMEAAEAVRCCRNTIRNLRKVGTLRTVYPRPGLPRLLREDVLKLAEPPAAE